ncbi:hypothetical protein ILYODFUR_025792 [Ilyodon furcidens]|uniref:Uncharacterized protein n=1 Tax=Ilyodon furcidens TaxID=33524 RepID=A0ABV0TY40_9TELE
MAKSGRSTGSKTCMHQNVGLLQNQHQKCRQSFAGVFKEPRDEHSSPDGPRREVSVSCNPGLFNHNPPTVKPWTQFPDRPRMSHHTDLPARSPVKPLRQSRPWTTRITDNTFTRTVHSPQATN